MRKQQQTTTAPTPLLVQFCHPGGECQVKLCDGATSTVVPWVGVIVGRRCASSCTDKEGVCQSKKFHHTRRLISHAGTYIDASNKPKQTQLAFWGEWEAETVAVPMSTPPRDRDLAHWIHTVKSPSQTQRVGSFNTDPCVFGKSFKYCCCQQRKRNSLRHLAPGSLVLFGSTINKQFYLDTVFVVDGEGVQYDATATEGLPVSDEYQELSLKRVVPGEYTFYRGKTPRAGEPYSFVPARRFKKDEPECGRRFKLDVAAVNACLPPGKTGLIAELGRFHHDIAVDPKVLASVWKEILRQVRKADFLPAVRFAWPK